MSTLRELEGGRKLYQLNSLVEVECRFPALMLRWRHLCLSSTGEDSGATKEYK